MEKGPESASALAWLWVIESLASFQGVQLSLLNEVSDMVSELPSDAGKDAREMVALRCLEDLFHCINVNGIRNDGSSPQCPKVTFDSSESCEDVLQRIFSETPESTLRVGGSEMLKWDIGPFITHKKTCMHCNLHQLKDAILDGTHPYADCMMDKCGLKMVNKKGEVPVSRVIEVNEMLDRSSCDPHSQNGNSKRRPFLLGANNERREAMKDPSSFRSSPFKSSSDFSSVDETRESLGWDYVYMNIKKLMQRMSNNFNSGLKEVASSQGIDLLETLSDRKDGYHNERSDISMKKNELFCSQTMINHKSFLADGGMDPSLCMKCNKGGEVLSCSASDCPLVVHEKCLGSSVQLNDGGGFRCPFCAYSLAISKYREAEKKFVMKRKNLATFICIDLAHQSDLIKNIVLLKDRSYSQNAGVQDAKICEGVDLVSKDSQVHPDGEHVEEVQKYVGHNTSLKDGTIVHAQPLRAITRQGVLHHLVIENKEKPAYALDIDRVDSFRDDDDFTFERRRCHPTSPANCQSKRRRVRWAAEEEEENTQMEGVEKFCSSVESPTIPRKKMRKLVQKPKT